MAILGVYDGHNAGAAVVSEATGEVLAAVEEERFSRIKNHDGRAVGVSGPKESVRYCLLASNEPINHVALALASPDEVEQQAVNEYLLSIRDGATERLDCLRVGDRWADYADVINFPKSSQGQRIQAIRLVLADAGLSDCELSMHYVPHHTAHAASAFLLSPIDSALVFTLDGKGDGLSGLVTAGRGTDLLPIASMDYRHSIAHLYAAFTVACGFRAIRDEGKLTALAAHGEVDQRLYEMLQGLFWFDSKSGHIHGRLNDGLPLGPYPHTLFGEQIARVKRLINGIDPANAAATVQRFVENLVVEMVDFHLAASHLSDVAVAGGLFANVSLNRRIAESDRVARLFVHPAMSDSGLALGAASFVFTKLSGRRPVSMASAHLGPEYADDISVAAFRSAGFEATDDSPEESLAEALARGEVVARFLGRAEYGPRALGNRSILAPCGDPGLPNRLNQQLARSQVMPFAPMTIAADADELYFGLSKIRWSARFMTVAVKCRKRMIDECPAAVHLDGTARPQLVNGEEPDLLHLLHRYKSLSGHSSVINTSLNVHHEPMVLTPADAARSIAESGIRIAQVGRYVCVRPELGHGSGLSGAAGR